MSENDALAVSEPKASAIERVLIGGDISQLKPDERIAYYKMICDSVGLNPLTKPFEYITLNGKLSLYARKDATDQLRARREISIKIVGREVVEDCYVVTAQATNPQGRTDESIGAVSIAALKGDARCNALMKAETKAKRRVTLSICGLGMLDETEIETIPSAKPPVQLTTEDIPIARPTAKAPAVDGHSGYETPLQPLPQPNRTDKPAMLPQEHIEDGQAVNFHKLFRDALKPQLRKKEKELSHEWLKQQGIVDSNGQPTAKAILKENFYEVREAAIEHAANLPV